MALLHAKPGEIIDVRPLEARLEQSVTTTLIKTDSLEVLRLVIPAGTHIAKHQVPGEITVHCLEGQLVFDAAGADRELQAGDLLYLSGGTPHALHAAKDSSVLVTILLHHKADAQT
jgi:quercetin dioxygenase-like cupin family protein